MGLVRDIWRFRSFFIVWLTPLLLLPVAIVYNTKSGRCAYGILLMAVYWISEAIPLAATALIPVALFPWLGIASSQQLCQMYLKDTTFLLLGGMTVAVAVQKCNLHKRVALRVLMLVGSRPKWLMFGLMGNTAFLSMWVSNTAATAMMVPIAHGVLLELKKHNEKHTEAAKKAMMGEARGSDGDCAEADEEPDETQHTGPNHCITQLNTDGTTDGTDVGPDHIDVKCRSPLALDTTAADHENQMTMMGKGFMLCVCYGAIVGGTSTLTGTGPNLIVKDLIDSWYGPEASVTFISWFIFAFPNMVLIVFAAWAWLVILFIGPRELFSRNTEQDNAANSVIKREYTKLGPMSFAEKAVLCHFLLMASLWLTREPGFVTGWAHYFPDGYVTDTSVVILVVVLLFIFPDRRPSLWCFKTKESDVAEPVCGLLDWPSVHHHVAWKVVLLVGSGFALAEACQVSGLSVDIAGLFVSFRGSLPSWVIVLTLCVVTTTFTEMTGNIAVASILLPIVAELANATQINPLYLLLPTTVASSYSFMLPVSTAPNAIVFGYGHLTIMDMVKAGLMLNVLGVLILQLSTNTWGRAYFRFDDIPSWARNATGMTSQSFGNVTTAPVFANNSSAVP